MSEPEKDARPCPEPGQTGLRWLFSLIGIEIGPWRNFRVEIRARFFVLTAALLAVGLAGMSGMAYYSTQPGFCNSCHIMEPYYHAWATSTHNMVSCVDCHYPPGTPKEMVWYKFQALSQVAKYVTRTYSSKPFAEIEDISCLRSGCHSDRLLQGKVVSQAGIIFDHKPHLEQPRYGRQLRCVSCHAQMVIGNHMEVTWDTCYLCHLKERPDNGSPNPGLDCRRCHLLPEEEITVGQAKVVHKDMAGFGPVKCAACHREPDRGEGKVSEDRCFTCHNQPEKLARRHETDFLHDNHVTKHSVACFHCHERITHGSTFKQKKEPEVLAAECGKCHQNQHDLNGVLYAGRGAEGLPEMPSLMFQAGVDCVGCHVVRREMTGRLSHGVTVTGGGAGCAGCHGDDYLTVVQNSQRMIDEAAALLSGNLGLVLRKMAASPPEGELKDKIEAKLAEAGKNLELAKSVKAVHNIYYLAEILYSVDRIVSGAARALQMEVAPTGDSPLVSGRYCAVMCHDLIGVKAEPAEIAAGGRKIPHAKHVEEGISCRVCHDFGAHKQSGFRGREVCLKCHAEDDLK